MSTSESAIADLPHHGLLPELRERWSPRAFDVDHTLRLTDLALLLDAARWAASAGNSQPWAFIVGLRGDETFDAFAQHLSRGNTAWAPRASALIITLHQVATDDDSDFYYSDYSAYDLGQAAAQLTVQAHALELHVHQFAGFDHDAVTEHFEVPSHWKVTTGIAIGKLTGPETLDEALAARETAPRSRKAISELAFAGKFGQSI